MVQYPAEFIDRLHLVWGLGFLSPGGPDEVLKIVDGLDLRGKRVLDIGCGTGGPAIVLARDLGARVVCIDVEQELLDRARRNADTAGVGGQIEFHLVAPGRLKFDDAAFDVVFSKDAMLHIPDKAALYRDVLRVLKPGGVFAASDWLKGDNAETDPGYQRYIEKGHLKFNMATPDQTRAALRAAGFDDVRTVDRQPWYAPMALQELRDIRGPLKAQLIKVSDQQTYDAWVNSRVGSSAAFNSGGLRPTHLRGSRPLG